MYYVLRQFDKKNDVLYQQFENCGWTHKSNDRICLYLLVKMDILEKEPNQN